GSDGAAANEALAALAQAILDRTAERAVRTAAYQALSTLPERIRGPLADAVRAAGDELSTAGLDEDATADAQWLDALDGRLPEDPGRLRHALRVAGQTAPLPALHRLIEAARAREAA